MHFFKRKKSYEPKYKALVPNPIFFFLEKMYSEELIKFPNKNKENSMLNNYSTKEIITFLREKRDVDIDDIPTSKTIEFKPYLGVIKRFEEIPITSWDGHYGFRNNGFLTLCNANGERIMRGNILSISKSGVITRTPNFTDQTSIKTDSVGQVIID